MDLPASTETPVLTCLVVYTRPLHLSSGMLCPGGTASIHTAVAALYAKLAFKLQLDACQMHTPVDLHTFSYIWEMRYVSIQFWGGQAAEFDITKLLLLLLKSLLSTARSLFAILS